MNQGGLLYEPMDDGDIKYYMPHLKIIKYNDLENYSNINKLLSKDKDYCLLLYEWEPNSGHWVSLLKYDGFIEYFDPYGQPINYWIKKEDILNQNPAILDKLLKTSNKQIVYNKIEFQDMENQDLATCGAHCVFRMKMLEKFDLNLKNYYLLLKTISETENITYDEIVVDIINKR
jgi:hypothetical protein